MQIVIETNIIPTIDVSIPVAIYPLKKSSFLYCVYRSILFQTVRAEYRLVPEIIVDEKIDGTYYFCWHLFFCRD